MEDPGRIGTRRIYTGKVLNLDIDTVKFPDGSTGELEIIRHSGASAVVPFLSDPTGPDPQLLLIRQYRYAANGYVYEIPAGRLDAGEDPLDCAHRELREETGCSAGQMQLLFSMFTTPGFTDERIHVFMAMDLTQGVVSREADEFVEVETMPLSRALEMIKRSEIPDGKTALAILFAAGYRAGL
jgi:ADP-ribose pyrophosphatase